MNSWLDNIRQAEPYTPGEQPKEQGIIKLNTNENPYPPSPMVEKALREMDTDLLRRYPDPACSLLVNALAEEYSLDPEEVFVGVGSDDVLAMCFLTFFNGEKPILFPDITYTFYDTWAKMLRIPYRTIPLNADFEINPEDYRIPNGGVIIANPNAPTGVLLELDKVVQIIEENPSSIVIVDEAYVDFGGASALPFIRRYDNLLVVQTFSKSRSLAGMRIGAAFANRQLIRYLNHVKYSFNSYTMNTPSLLAGYAAVKDRGYFEETRAKIIATRERVKPLLSELGFSFKDSQTNFIFAEHNTMTAQEIFDALRAKKIYVRHFHFPRIENYLRITIGTDDEMDTLLSELKGIVTI